MFRRVIAQNGPVPLPAEARHRAARDLVEELSSARALPASTIPIDGTRWNRFVDRLTPRVEDLLAMAPRVADAAASDDFQMLRAVARDTASALRIIDDHLVVAAMFDHPRHTALRRLRAGLQTLGTTWSSRLRGEASDPNGPDRAVAEIRSAVSDVRAEQVDDDHDSWLICFGVARDRLTDPQGRVTAPLLVAAFHGRIDELAHRAEGIFAGLAGPGWGPQDAVRHVSALLDCGDPVEVAYVAMRIRALLQARSRIDPHHMRSVLGRLFGNVEASHANSEMNAHIRQDIEGIARPDRRAMLVLDLYRRVCEGQVRPWGWALVCLLTGVDGAVPMLGELRARLTAAHDDLADAFVDVLVPEARNAAAHEQYRWDSMTGCLTDGEHVYDPNELSALAQRGHDLMVGAELGWALAAAEIPAARSSQAAEDRLSVLKVRRALERFATNELRVTDWHLQGGRLCVEVESVPLEAINSCAQALIEAADLVPVDGIEVRLAGKSLAIMVASRPALDALLPVWRRTCRRGIPMPSAVFLPILLESRLLVETTDQAVDATLWMVLNEAVRTFDELLERSAIGTPLPSSLAVLADDLRLVREALIICWLVAPAYSALKGNECDLLLRAILLTRTAPLLVDPARQWALHDLHECGRELASRWTRMASCAPLPTVDGTRLP